MVIGVPALGVEAFGVPPLGERERGRRTRVGAATSVAFFEGPPVDFLAVAFPGFTMVSRRGGEIGS